MRVIKQLKVQQDNRTGRLRARTVSTFSVGDELPAIDPDLWHATVDHGGSVANSYGYRAWTEVVGLIMDPEGRCLVAYDQIPANKVTRRGAALATIPEIAKLFDGRSGKAAKAEAWRWAKWELMAAYEPWARMIQEYVEQPTLMGQAYLLREQAGLRVFERAMRDPVYREVLELTEAVGMPALLRVEVQDEVQNEVRNPTLALAILDVVKAAAAVARADLDTVVALYVGEIKKKVAKALDDPNPYPLLKAIDQELRRPTETIRRPTKDSDYRELAGAVRRLMRFF